jgi:hypothetical protein
MHKERTTLISLAPHSATVTRLLTDKLYETGVAAKAAFRSDSFT